MSHKMSHTGAISIILLLVAGLWAVGSFSSRAEAGSVLNSPLPTPSIVPTVTPPSEWSQQALRYIATLHDVPLDKLFVVNEHERSYPLTGRTFRAFTVLDTRTPQSPSYSFLIDMATGKVEEDVAAVRAAEEAASSNKYGKLQSALYDRLQQVTDETVLPVAIWLAPRANQRTVPQVYAELAARFPEAAQALAKGTKPFDVDDPALAERIRQAYDQLRAEDMSARAQPVIDWLTGKGFTVMNYAGMPSVAARLPKWAILALATQEDVAMIYLTEERGSNTMDIAAPTDRVPAVWQRGINGSGQRVAIIEDNNISSSCLNVVATRNGVPYPGSDLHHSTRVANIVACNADPYRGVAYSAQIIDAGYDATNWPGPSSEQDAVSALTWAIASPQNARTVNVSQGWEIDNEMNWMDRVFDYWAREKNVTLVVAAGNEGTWGGSLGSPAKAWNVISVGGTDDHETADWSDDRMASFSSYVDPTSGPNGHGDREKPEVVAPAVDIAALGRGGVTTFDSGTSYAAPQVAGLAALLMNRHSSLTIWPEAVKAIIMASAVHNIEGPSDIPSYQDLKDAALADTIAKTRPDSGVVCNSPCWWGIFTSNTNPVVGGSIYQYFTASRGERIRVAISWFASADTPLKPPDLARDELLTNYQLYVYKPSGGNPIGNTASWDNNYELVDFVAPETGQYQIRIYRQPEGDYNESSNSLGIAWARDATYLPDLRNKDGWVSTLYVRNDGAVLRDAGINSKVKIHYFNTNGNPIIQDECILLPNQWCGIPVNENGRIPAGTTGSAIVGGGEDVSVVVVNSTTVTQYAYSGQPLLNVPATTLYLPETLDLGTWQMRFPVFNTGTAVTNITTQFLNTTGGTLTTQVASNVPANGQSNEFPLSVLDPNHNYSGAGRISASQPIAAVARAYDNPSRVLGYWATSTAHTTVWLPFVMTRLSNGWGATIWVQNTTGSASTVTLDFFQEGSRSVYRTTGAVTLSPNGMTSFNLRTNDYGLGWGWFGSARVTAGQPVAVIVNQLNDGSNLGASYEGVPASHGSQSVVLPYVVRGAEGCLYSNFTVKNLGSADAAIVINYYAQPGTLITTSPDTVVSHRVYNLYTGTPPGQNFPTPPFGGSVIINSTQPIAVSSNLLNYCGGSDTVSYTGLNR